MTYTCPLAAGGLCNMHILSIKESIFSNHAWDYKAEKDIPLIFFR